MLLTCGTLLNVTWQAVRGELCGEWVYARECLSPFSVHLKLLQV